MNAILATAVEKLVGKLKTPVSIGTHQVDEYITLHVVGEVKKFADETYIPTVSVPLKPALAILLHLMGFQREKAADILVKAMTMALNNGTDSTAEIEAYMKDIDACMLKVESLSAALPPATRTGKTTVKGSIQIVPAVVSQPLDKAI